MAQLVRNLPAMWESWIWTWVGKILGERKATQSVFWAWRILWIASHGASQRVSTTEQLSPHVLIKWHIYNTLKNFYVTVEILFWNLWPFKATYLIKCFEICSAMQNSCCSSCCQTRNCLHYAWQKLQTCDVSGPHYFMAINQIGTILFV